MRRKRKIIRGTSWIAGNAVVVVLGSVVLESGVILLCMRIIEACIHIRGLVLGCCCWLKAIRTIQFEVHTMLMRNCITVAVLVVAELIVVVAVVVTIATGIAKISYRAITMTIAMTMAVQ